MIDPAFSFAFLCLAVARPFGELGRAHLATPSAGDPKGQKEAYAQNRDGWRLSERAELDNHQKNGSFEWIDRSAVPRGRRLVKLVWVYKRKRDGRLKSRLCVQGCTMQPGVDYDQTWSGAMRSASLRSLAAISAGAGLKMRRFDFVAAYLQGELEPGEVVYCLPPLGYESEHVDARGQPQIAKIVKPIYGMSQAGRRWQRTLFPWLKELGFVQLDGDTSVFRKKLPDVDGVPGEELIVGVYVDDLCVCHGAEGPGSLYADFVSKLFERWEVEDEGSLNDLLGIEFEANDGHVLIHQCSYIERLVTTHLPDGITSKVQANTTPCDSDLPLLVANALSSTEAPDASVLKQYQSLCGALLYCATNCRPDIAFSVGMLCRAMSRPTPELLDAARRVLAYLYRNRHIGLRYKAQDRPLHGYTDSDWGVRHSTSGHVFMYNSACISWSSKKQPSVALSSCEAEIMAASEAAKEAVYLRKFFQELGRHGDAPIDVGLDNKSAGDLAYNPEHHPRTKHIDRRHFYVRECVEDHRLRVPFVASADNLADFFTKPLNAKTFFRLRDEIMNVPHSNPGGRPPSTKVAKCVACGDTGFVKGTPCYYCNDT